MNQQYFKTLAATYNCGAYGAGSFDEGTKCQTTQPPSNTTGGLVNTGMNVYLPLAIGVILIAVALGVLITTLKRKRTAHKDS